MLSSFHFFLQNLFSLIRGRNGFNDRPELPAFLGALRSIAASGLAQPTSQGRNCQDDGCTAAVDEDSACKLSDCGPADDDMAAKEFPDSTSRARKLAAASTKAKLRTHPNPALDEPLEYIAGYVLLKSRVMNCDACRSTLTAATAAGIHIGHKKFEHAVRGLINPSEIVLTAFRRMEAIFVGLQIHNLLKKKAAAGIVKEFQENIVQLQACQKHQEATTRSIYFEFARLRLRQWCREQMDRFRAGKLRHRNAKKLNKLHSCWPVSRQSATSRLMPGY